MGSMAQRSDPLALFQYHDPMPEHASNRAHAVKKAKPDDLKALIEKVDCFIFDCDGEVALASPHHLRNLQANDGHDLRQRAVDRVPAICAGVIWRGDSLIEGVSETIDLLRSLVCG